MGNEVIKLFESEFELSSNRVFFKRCPGDQQPSVFLVCISHTNRMYSGRKPQNTVSFLEYSKFFMSFLSNLSDFGHFRMYFQNL